MSFSGNAPPTPGGAGAPPRSIGALGAFPLLELRPPWRRLEEAPGPVNDAKQHSLRPRGSCCFAGKAIFSFGFSLLLPVEYDESSRLAVSACTCVRAFARSCASGFKKSTKKKCNFAISFAIAPRFASFTGQQAVGLPPRPDPRGFGFRSVRRSARSDHQAELGV